MEVKPFILPFGQVAQVIMKLSFQSLMARADVMGEPSRAQPVLPPTAYCCTVTWLMISARELMGAILPVPEALAARVSRLLVLSTPELSLRLPLMLCAAARLAPEELLSVRSKNEVGAEPPMD